MATKKAPKASSKKASKKSTKRTKAQDDGVCLLSYMPSTYPVPIQTGTGQTPAQAVLNTAALPGAGKTVYCNQVVIAVPIGPDAGDIFRQTPTASVNTGKWAISSTEVKKGRDLGIAGDEDGDYATFTFDCRDASDYLINYNLVFGVSGAVSPVASQCTVQIMENSGTSKDPSTFTSKTCSYTITTSTPQFYLTNFTAYATAAPTVPATEFANGADINFSWESNGTFFQIFEKNQTTPVYAGTQTTFKLTGGVATDTTFVLAAMVSGNPSGDKPQGGYEPIYLFDALTITISNPDLTPKSAKISGNASVGGTLGVTGQTTLANASVGGTLGVSGNTTLGNATVSGTLNATGTASLADARVGGMLGVGGNATLASATVNGMLTANSAATLNGGLTATRSRISMLTGAQSVSPATYTANTDGFVVGVVWGPSNVDLGCWTYIYGGNSDGVTVRSLGGNVGAFDSGWTKWRGNNQNSFMFPVRRGTTWYVSVWNPSTNQTNGSTAFYWIPLGNNSAGQTIERVGDAPELKSPLSRRVGLPPEKKIQQLVKVIEKIVGRDIERGTRKELISVLTSLQTEDYVSENFEE